MKGKCLFRVGLDVWSMAYGWGKVYKIRENVGYPVDVEYIHPILGRVIISYSNEGKYHETESRTLFFEEIPIPQSALDGPRQTAKEMLDECEEVEFLEKHNNHAIGYIPATNQIVENLDWICKRVGVKYISRQDAERIVRECAENNG